MKVPPEEAAQLEFEGERKQYPDVERSYYENHSEIQKRLS